MPWLSNSVRPQPGLRQSSSLAYQLNTELRYSLKRHPNPTASGTRLERASQRPSGSCLGCLVWYSQIPPQSLSKLSCWDSRRNAPNAVAAAIGPEEACGSHAPQRLGRRYARSGKGQERRDEKELHCSLASGIVMATMRKSHRRRHEPCNRNCEPPRTVHNGPDGAGLDEHE